MKIADLFVSLGIKGDGQAQKALTGVKATLGGISTEGLAAKAAIVGVVYSMQRLAGNSAQTGADLMSFASATGMSMDALQRWQYAAKMANVSGDEMKGTIIGVQQTMQKMTQNGQRPAGFDIIANATGIDFKRVNEQMYVVKKVRDYLKMEKDVSFANDKALSMGYTLEMIAAARRGMLDDDVLAKAPVYGEGQVRALDKVKSGMAGIGVQWEMGMGNLTAQFGPDMVKGIGGVSKEIIQMIGAFAQLSKQTSLLSGIGLIFKGWGEIFGVISAGVDSLTNFAESMRSQDKKDGGEGGLIPSWDVVKTRWNKMKEELNTPESKARQKQLLMQAAYGDDAASMMNRPIAKNPNKGTTIIQTNHIHADDGRDVVNQIHKSQKRATTKAASKSNAKVEAN